MEILDAIRANLLSPAVIFFVLGLIAALTKSDLKFPEPLYIGLTIYLLVAIGFKGGVAVAEAGIAASSASESSSPSPHSCMCCWRDNGGMVELS